MRTVSPAPAGPETPNNGTAFRSKLLFADHAGRALAANLIRRPKINSLVIWADIGVQLESNIEASAVHQRGVCRPCIGLVARHEQPQTYEHQVARAALEALIDQRAHVRQREMIDEKRYLFSDIE